MAQQSLGAAQPIMDSIREPYKKVRKFFGYDKEETAERKAPAAKDDRVEAANASFRKRAESEKLAANRKLGAKPTPKKGKSSRKRAAKSY